MKRDCRWVCFERYEDYAINQGFEFRNPNVKDACGCDESFSV